MHEIHMIARLVSLGDAISQTLSPMDQITAQNSHVWVQYVPDGAVSVAVEGSTLLLRACTALQERFETLLAKRKAGALSVEETREYQAIGDLDAILSWLNRLARESRNA